MLCQRVPIFDNRGEDLLGHMGAAVEFIRTAAHYGAVLVHCNQGRSRSGSFIIGYMMQVRADTSCWLTWWCKM